MNNNTTDYSLVYVLYPSRWRYLLDFNINTVRTTFSEKKIKILL